ncbi:MAG: PEPxxWA-CTERM sorting domain-containing protein [Sandarakinorhabdus sp.]|nr:PEPxxWA-CTERM sorting domain-containing protein [Sandarakinorhabdus sp.]
MKKFTSLVIAGAALGVIASPASAVIVLGTLTGGNYFDLGGSFVVTNAAATPVVGVDAINKTNVYGLNERQGVALTKETRFWTVDALTLESPEVDLGIGTKVASHLIFIDPAEVPDPAIASGTVTFSGKILGYRWSHAQLDGTTALLGAKNITYGDLMQLETANDEISFSGNTLTYNLLSKASSGDFLRVITTVPEPTSWLMLVTGFSLVGFAARRRQRAVAA